MFSSPPRSDGEGWRSCVLDRAPRPVLAWERTAWLQDVTNLGMSSPCVLRFGFPSGLICVSGCFSLHVSQPVFPSVPLFSANLCLCISFRVSPVVAFRRLRLLLSLLSVSLSWAPPAPGPGHPPESAPPLLDGPRHGRLLLRLHAPGLDAPQLDCLRLWTLAGQRHGESRRVPAEARAGRWTAGCGQDVRAGPLLPLHQPPVLE